ncbi:MAG: transporter substrate-binding domain-containing protein [Clostridia bacterium]|nr:transporter substrate-binding domain-containing protein [Clostridia bacterium]
MKKKLGIVLAVVATAVISIVSLVGCTNTTTFKLEESQIKALTEVNLGKADVAFIDSTMANYMLSTRDNFKGLKMITLEDFDTQPEEYGIAGRKAGEKQGSEKLIKFINARLYELKDTGYAEVIEKWGLQSRKIDIQNPGYTSADCDGWKDELMDSSKLVIGYTLNPPMGDNDATGFDFDLAKKIFEGTGVTIEGKIIVWKNQTVDLNKGDIDLVWNGMTINDSRKANMNVSSAYLTNEQAIVVQEKKADKYKTVSDLKNSKVVAESNSAGQDAFLDILKNIDKEAYDEFIKKNPTLG